MSAFNLRDLVGMDEFLKAEELQRVVWGKDDTADPADLMMVIQHEGGLVAGAFEDGELIGYVFGFPTRTPSIQHSHRLAVSPKARGRGLAIALKHYQRQWCLERGITLIRWTFDPLRHLNASLNVGRLGVTVSSYLPDYYGAMKGINSGLASDRILAEWAISSPEMAKGTGDTALKVRIPDNIDRLLVTDKKTAEAERLRVRHELTQHFKNGYTITGYNPSLCSYLLTTSLG